MTKVMRYENGKAITGQVDAPFKVDWSEWQTMTDAQKKGKKWLIENVPGAEGEIDAELLTKLWENPAPTSSFAAQTITLNSSDYDFLLVTFNSGITSNITTISNVIKKGNNLIATECYTGSGVNNVSTGTRVFTYVTDTSYSFGDALLQTQGSARAVNNSIIIPMQIYGFKSTVKIKFDALAKDVSTLASKCMLADGETSVEDAIEIIIPPTITDYASYKNAGGNRGEDITKYWKDGSLADRIDGVNGFKPFEDLYLWDYIDLDSDITAPSSGGGSTTGTKRIHIGEFNGLNNYQLNKVTDNTNFFNHLRMVTGTHFGMSKMNDSNTTANGYLGSKMHTTIIGNISTSGTLAKQLYDQLGSLLVPTTELLTNSVNASGYNRLGANSGCSNNWTWADVYARLLSEIESNGSIVWSSSGYDTGNAQHQLPAFKNDKSVAYPQGIYYWLKDVATSTDFCSSDGRGGNAYCGSASLVRYVRLLLTIGRKPS